MLSHAGSSSPFPSDFSRRYGILPINDSIFKRRRAPGVPLLFSSARIHANCRKCAFERHRHEEIRSPSVVFTQENLCHLSATCGRNDVSSLYERFWMGKFQNCVHRSNRKLKRLIVLCKDSYLLVFSRKKMKREMCSRKDENDQNNEFRNIPDFYPPLPLLPSPTVLCTLNFEAGICVSI